MKTLWRRYPWLPLALLTAGFMLAWLFWLVTAFRHAPESVLPSSPTIPPHAATR